jgi:hypothetical protein
MQGECKMNYKSRLAADFLGQDAFWKKEANECLKRNINEYEIKDNALVWKSNGRLVPTDIIELLHAARVIDDIQFISALVSYDYISAKEIEEIKEMLSNREQTQEELSEMRNAFGEGEVVVNVITGKKTKL